MRFIAQLNDGKYLNLPASKMTLHEDGYILVYNGEELVAFVDVGCLVSAHLSAKGDSNG